MSKASEWVAKKIDMEAHVDQRPTFSAKTTSGDKNNVTFQVDAESNHASAPTLDVWAGGGWRKISETDALRLARWILDTFGEADASGASA